MLIQNRAGREVFEMGRGMIKHCCDCRWVRPSHYGRTFQYAMCAHPRVGGAELLVSPDNQSGRYCSTERMGGWSDRLFFVSPCGKAGRLWEAKATHPED